MADFARPTAEEFDSYYQTYLDLVPTDVTDILQHLKKQGLEMLTLMRTLDDNRAEYRYQPEKWSIKEVIGHLARAACMPYGPSLPVPQPGPDGHRPWWFSERVQDDRARHPVVDRRP